MPIVRFTIISGPGASGQARQSAGESREDASGRAIARQCGARAYRVTANASDGYGVLGVDHGDKPPRNSGGLTICNRRRTTFRIEE